MPDKPAVALPGLQRLLFLVIGGLTVAVGFSVAAWKPYSFSVTIAVPDLPDVVLGTPPPMGLPELAAAPPLPDAVTLADAVGEARELLTTGGPLPVWADGCDPVALAWAAAVPLAAPQRVGAWELYRAKLLPGTAVRLRGERAGESPDRARPWRRGARRGCGRG